MTEREETAVRKVISVFDTKCVNLKRHRNPIIFKKDNKEQFSNWFENGLGGFEIIKLGANDHPDFIIDGVGMELKSKRDLGSIQFNSTIPTGGFKHKGHEGECYYAIARYDTERDNGYLQDFTICDGDYFNHNREAAFSHQNTQETNFGDYEDGVCRYRKMYVFPNPLREVRGISLISKFDDLDDFNPNLIKEAVIERVDKEGDTYHFHIYRHRLIE